MSDADGWQTVKPRKVRKVKSNKKEKKVQEKQVTDVSAVTSETAGENAKMPAISSKKAKKRSSTKIRVKKEEDLVLLVHNIVSNVPEEFTPISTLGDRITDAIGSSWNKKFKYDLLNVISNV